MDRFRATFIVLFLTWSVPRVYYRIKGLGRVQEKVREKWAIPARIFLGLPFMVGLALYIFHPHTLRRTNFPISDFWRWTGARISAPSCGYDQTRNWSPGGRIVMFAIPCTLPFSC